MIFRVHVSFRGVYIILFQALLAMILQKITHQSTPPQSFRENKLQELRLTFGNNDHKGPGQASAFGQKKRRLGAVKLRIHGTGIVTYMKTIKINQM